MFDLTTLDTKTAANEGFEMEILHPVTLDGTGFMITVLGEDSDAYRKITHQQQQRRLKRAMSSRKGVVAASEALDDLDDDQLEVLSACTKAWRMSDGSAVMLNEKPLACSPENSRTLYAKLPVVRRQVEAAMGDRANFTPRSASN
jgi:hypothetical protein